MAAPILAGVILIVLLALPLNVPALVPLVWIVKVPVVLAASVAVPPADDEPAYLCVWLEDA